MGDLAAIDLHIHTALSPCADDRMQPPAILLAAERRGVAVVGVVDHNTARNAAAVLAAAEAFAVRCLVGLEIESREGVHVLSLFDHAAAAMTMDELVSEHLPDMPNDADRLGQQHLLDYRGDLVARDLRLLLAGTTLRLNEIVSATGERGGLAIPAHIDRRANGLLGVLGFVPPDLQTPLFELSPHASAAQARGQWPSLARVPLLTASDAHRPEAIGSAPTWISRELARADLPLLDWGREVAGELLAAAEAQP